MQYEEEQAMEATPKEVAPLSPATRQGRGPNAAMRVRDLQSTAAQQRQVERAHDVILVIP